MQPALAEQKRAGLGRPHWRHRTASENACLIHMDTAIGFGPEHAIGQEMEIAVSGGGIGRVLQAPRQDEKADRILPLILHSGIHGETTPPDSLPGHLPNASEPPSAPFVSRHARRSSSRLRRSPQDDKPRIFKAQLRLMPTIC